MVHASTISITFIQTYALTAILERMEKLCEKEKKIRQTSSIFLVLIIFSEFLSKIRQALLFV